MRYSAFFAGRGDKEASDTAETGAAQMWDEKKKGAEKNPKPNSIFGLGSDLASFNLELFAYSDQWDHHSLQPRHKAALVAFGAKPQGYLHLPSTDSGNGSESFSFGVFHLFFLAFCPWQSNLRQHYLLTLKKKKRKSLLSKEEREI